MMTTETTTKITHIEIQLGGANGGRYAQFEAAKVEIRFIDGVAMACNPANEWEIYGQAVAARRSDNTWIKLF